MVSIGKWLLYGLVGAFAISALVDPQRAFATTQAFKGVGGALGSLGGGVQSLFTGIGTGAAKLFNPLFTLRDLIYGPQAGLQVQTDVREVSSTGGTQTTSQQIMQAQNLQLDPTAPSTPITTGFGGAPLGTTLQNFSSSQAQTGFQFKTVSGFGSQPVALAVFHGQTLPLSATAIAQYQKLGVTVSPASNQTVSSNNPSNATSNSSASSNYSAGAAQAAGFSRGSPR